MNKLVAYIKSTVDIRPVACVPTASKPGKRCIQKRVGCVNGNLSLVPKHADLYNLLSQKAECKMWGSFAVFHPSFTAQRFKDCTDVGVPGKPASKESRLHSGKQVDFVLKEWMSGKPPYNT